MSLRLTLLEVPSAVSGQWSAYFIQKYRLRYLRCCANTSVAISVAWPLADTRHADTRHADTRHADS
ncbi:hypothetical protein BJP36_38560 [Moorena producens JHB]|uniref:Uncharacterized protein n=1 Tax=Moorena producens (strain JHB) TaxID=1454205 RepID=A0A9Q9UWK5_MOOP1|nr:hypothetical protein [Moorena producens]WAN69979.1 hypothetical protein BJP36_38560 [Moorena producens JHB]